MEGSSDGNTPTIKGLEPIPVVSMNDAIQERLHQFIREQGLSAGDKLPSENRLAHSLGVSRNALREALRSLEALGVVQVRVGSGWYVQKMTFDAVAEALSLSLELDPQVLDGLYRIRACLECGFVGEAMRTLTPEDIKLLGRLIDEMEAAAVDGGDVVRLDRDFHRALYRGLHNPVLERLIDIFFKITEYEQRQYRPEKSTLDTAQEHRDILHAVAAGDKEQACRIITESLQPYLSLGNAAK